MELITLNNKPLVEAIFEVRWELKTYPNGSVVDDHYDLVVGQMRQALIKELPFYVKLPFGQIPGLLIPYQVQHQFRLAADAWPLVQIGPGVMSVNETGGYTAERFIPFCSKVFNDIVGFWNQNGHVPKVLHVSLRYIDADVLNEDRLSFLKKLGINIAYEKDIFGSKAFQSTIPKFVECKSEFNTNNPAGTFSLTVNSGMKDNQEAILWETQMICNQDQCSTFVENPAEWLSNAHNICHDVFFAMIKGELEEKYR